MSQKKYVTSAAALHAARTLMNNFTFEAKSKIPPTERNVATIIDVCTQVFRVEEAMDALVCKTPWMDKHDLRANMEMLQDAIRAVDIVRNRMPSFTNGAELPRTKMDPREHFTRKQIEAAEALTRRVSQARTVGEQQRVLAAAGLVQRRRR
jgi:hypothetical protein